MFTGLTGGDLHIRNVYQREANVEPKGIVGFPVSNMNFDRMTVHDIGGCGWYMHSASRSYRRKIWMGRDRSISL